MRDSTMPSIEAIQQALREPLSRAPNDHTRFAIYIVERARVIDHERTQKNRPNKAASATPRGPKSTQTSLWSARSKFKNAGGAGVKGDGPLRLRPRTRHAGAKRSYRCRRLMWRLRTRPRPKTQCDCALANMPSYRILGSGPGSPVLALVECALGLPCSSPVQDSRIQLRLPPPSTHGDEVGAPNDPS
jgi:hypothetical protein